MALVVIVGIVLWATTGDEAEAPTNGDEAAMEEQDGTMSQGSLRDLLAMEASQECTFSDADTDSEGTFYVDDGRMRGDFTTTQDGQTMTAHIIVTGETVYTWIDGQSQGFQVSVDADAEAEASGSAVTDLDREVSYECNATAVSETQFELPEGVTFTDFSRFQQ